MPSIVTHYLFAKDVFEALPKKIKTSFQNQKKTYLLFSQSFDNLFYYKFLTPFLGNSIRKLGISAQKEKTDTYFLNIISYMKDKHLDTNEEIRAYLFGSITHYVLDYHCHPYVFYYTDDANLNLRYRGLHEKMEVNIDAYMLQKKNGKNLNDANLASTLLPKLTFSKDLKELINIVFEETFKVNQMGRKYEEASRTGQFLLKYFVTDKKGYKKKLYRLKDTLTFFSKRRYEYLSFHVTQINTDYLNLKHEVWYNPWSKKKSTASFEDLYAKALLKAVEIITVLDKYFKEEISLNEMKKTLKDYSYITGLSWQDKRKPSLFKI